MISNPCSCCSAARLSSHDSTFHPGSPMPTPHNHHPPHCDMYRPSRQQDLDIDKTAVQWDKAPEVAVGCNASPTSSPRILPQFRQPWRALALSSSASCRASWVSQERPSVLSRELPLLAWRPSSPSAGIPTGHCRMGTECRALLIPEGQVLGRPGSSG